MPTFAPAVCANPRKAAAASIAILPIAVLGVLSSIVRPPNDEGNFAIATSKPGAKFESSNMKPLRNASSENRPRISAMTFWIEFSEFSRSLKKPTVPSMRLAVNSAPLLFAVPPLPLSPKPFTTARS